MRNDREDKEVTMNNIILELAAFSRERSVSETSYKIHTDTR